MTTDMSPDGKRLVLQQVNPGSGSDVMELSLDPDRQLRPLVQSPFTERNGVISPDGRWLAYESNSTGRFEIYIRPFPDVETGEWQLTTSGGIQPRWSRSGSELFYVNLTSAMASALMSVRVNRGTIWSATAPTKLFDTDYFVVAGGSGQTQYDVAADGRFLVPKPAPSSHATAPQLVIVHNWFEELKRLVPAK